MKLLTKLRKTNNLEHTLIVVLACIVVALVFMAPKNLLLSISLNPQYTDLDEKLLGILRDEQQGLTKNILDIAQKNILTENIKEKDSFSLLNKLVSEGLQRDIEAFIVTDENGSILARTPYTQDQGNNVFLTTL